MNSYATVYSFGGRSAGNASNMVDSGHISRFYSQIITAASKLSPYSKTVVPAQAGTTFQLAL